MLDGHTLDSGLDVVLAVHVRIDHVVEDGPRNVRAVQASGGRESGRAGEEVDAKGGETHDGAPRESQAENGLRVVRYSLGEWVRRNKEQAGDAIEEARCGKLEEDSKTSEKLRTGEYDALERSDGLASNGPELCSRHVRVEIPIPEVVNGAARAAHDEGAGEEERRRSDDSTRCRHGVYHGSGHESRK